MWLTLPQLGASVQIYIHAKLLFIAPGSLFSYFPGNKPTIDRRVMYTTTTTTSWVCFKLFHRAFQVVALFSYTEIKLPRRNPEVSSNFLMCLRPDLSCSRVEGWGGTFLKVHPSRTCAMCITQPSLSLSSSTTTEMQINVHSSVQEIVAVTCGTHRPPSYVHCPLYV